MQYQFDKIYKTHDNIELHYSQGIKKIFSHTHDFYEICIATADGIINQIDNKSYVLKNRECLFIFPHNKHTLSTNNAENVSVFNISVRKNFFESCWEFLFGNKEILIDQVPIVVSERRLAEYQALFLELGLTTQPNRRYLEKKLVLELIFFLSKSQNIKLKNETFPQWLENVIAYFKDQKNYTNAETLETVYKISGYSKPQFNKLFKKYINKSPIEYYNECKIEAAKFILLESNLSITHIAYYLGFNSPAHFIHLFKQLIGTTPLRFRKNYTLDNI